MRLDLPVSHCVSGKTPTNDVTNRSVSSAVVRMHMQATPDAFRHVALACGQRTRCEGIYIREHGQVRLLSQIGLISDRDDGVIDGQAIPVTCACLVRGPSNDGEGPRSPYLHALERLMFVEELSLYVHSL